MGSQATQMTQTQLMDKVKWKYSSYNEGEAKRVAVPKHCHLRTTSASLI